MVTTTNDDHLDGQLSRPDSDCLDQTPNSKFWPSHQTSASKRSWLNFSFEIFTKLQPSLDLANIDLIRPLSRVAEVVRGHRGPPPKSLDSDKNFKPKQTLFRRELRCVTIYALFGDLWAKQVPFWVKNSVSWARSALLHGIYCIFHWVKFANLWLRAKTTHLTQKL